MFCSFRAKYAIGAIKKKLNDKNPHVALYALEVCVYSGNSAVEILLLNYFSAGEKDIIIFKINQCVVYTHTHTVALL